MRASRRATGPRGEDGPGGRAGPPLGDGAAAEVPADLHRAAGPDHRGPVAGRKLAAVPARAGRRVRREHDDPAAGPAAARRRGPGRHPARPRHLRGAALRARPRPPAQLRQPTWPPRARRSHPAAGRGRGRPARGGRRPARRPGARRSCAAGPCAWSAACPPSSRRPSQSPVHPPPGEGRDPRDLAPAARSPDGLDRGLYTQLAERGLAVARATETITSAALTPRMPATSAVPRGARPCSATGSASPPRATRSSTTTPCCPATASPSRPTAPPTRSRSATPRPRLTPGRSVGPGWEGKRS